MAGARSPLRNPLGGNLHGTVKQVKSYRSVIAIAEQYVAVSPRLRDLVTIPK